MQGSDVYNVLKLKHIHHLYHANTVTTSCTFLKLGGLASRGHVSDLGLPQTPQASDDIDQKYGIWYDVFADTVDIHERARIPNEYGPILFTLEADILNSLPTGSEVLVTKNNPIYWVSGQTREARFFTTVTELESSLEKGTFAQMVVIGTPNGILPFQNGKVSITVDDPQRNLSSGAVAFTHAIAQISTSSGNLSIPTKKRSCGYGCTCIQKYKTFNDSDFDKFFQ